MSCFLPREWPSRFSYVPLETIEMPVIGGKDRQALSVLFTFVLGIDPSLFA
jgi:hypothetical protein